MAYRWNLENVISTLDNLKANKKPVWGSMNAQRMVEHLSESIQIASGKSPQPLLIPEEKIERMQLFLESDKPMARGIEVPHAPKDAKLKYDDLELAVDEFVEDWIMFEDLYAENPGHTEVHSFYGPLNFDQWCKLNDKHLNHHFEQFGLI